MEFAKVTVDGACLRTVWAEDIPAGTVGGTVIIEYTDPVWDSLVKTVVFDGCVVRDVLNAGSTVTIPAEVVEKPCGRLRMGVYGVDPGGEQILPTFWTELGRVRQGTDPSGDPSTDPGLPVWAQLQAMIGDLDRLDTEAKETLVAAINEALTKGGGTVDEETVRQIVEEYLKENPPVFEESDPTVPEWAKQPTKPSYTASEVGALPADTVIPTKPGDIGAQPETLVVIYSNGVASHSPLEINEHIQKGGNVVLMYGDTKFDYMQGDNGEAVFRYVSYINNEQFEVATVCIYADKTVEVEFSGYTIPTLPTVVSAFTNDVGYLTEVPEGYAKTTDIPTDDHINQLINTALGVIENGTY